MCVTRSHTPRVLTRFAAALYSVRTANFKELSTLGRGTFGEVVKVQNKVDHRIYAVKKVFLGNASNPCSTALAMRGQFRMMVLQFFLIGDGVGRCACQSTIHRSASASSARCAPSRCCSTRTSCATTRLGSRAASRTFAPRATMTAAIVAAAKVPTSQRHPHRHQ